MSESKGFRVTCEDLDTGDTKTMIVYPGDFMLIPFAPCRLVSTQRYPKAGTMQLTLRGYGPVAPVREEDESASGPPAGRSEKYRVGARIRFPLAGHIYLITAVDAEPPCTCEYPFDDESHGHHPNCASHDEGQRLVTFAEEDDPEDSSSESVNALNAAHVEVLP